MKAGKRDRSRTKKIQREKDSIRCRIKLIRTCGECKHLFKSHCQEHDTQRYKIEHSCSKFEPIV